MRCRLLSHLKISASKVLFNLIVNIVIISYKVKIMIQNRYTCVVLALLLSLFGCKKDSEVNSETFKISDERVSADVQSVTITGTYSYSGTIDGKTLELGRLSDMADSEAHRLLLQGKEFSVTVSGLRPNTLYYYRYSVEYGGKEAYRTVTSTFETNDYRLPEVETLEISSVGISRTEAFGEVTSDGGGDTVTLRGFRWSQSHNPSVADSYVSVGHGMGSFSCELTSLQPEKTYYVRAYAGNSKGIRYGSELTFVTLAKGSLPTVTTVPITDNVLLSAMAGGDVLEEGSSEVLERGVCYGTAPNPTTRDLHVSSGSGSGPFTCRLTDLEPNTTYHVRAYAINRFGISYGGDMSFVAKEELSVAEVVTDRVKSISNESATGGGIVKSDGGSPVTERGLCWGVFHNPTVDGSHLSCGGGTGSFSCMMSHLSYMTTYYVRAYAVNAIGTSYGEEVSFTVGFLPGTPLVETLGVTDVSANTAVG